MSIGLQDNIGAYTAGIKGVGIKSKINQIALEGASSFNEIIGKFKKLLDPYPETPEKNKKAEILEVVQGGVHNVGGVFSIMYYDVLQVLGEVIASKMDPSTVKANLDGFEAMRIKFPGISELHEVVGEQIPVIMAGVALDLPDSYMEAAGLLVPKVEGMKRKKSSKIPPIPGLFEKPADYIRGDFSDN
jgi:hypothetical protein